ncbi:MAG TPA: hypothetical protein VG370_22540 [Chloroflexota bacterium]|nr:hypothetical protein [Chloroflexota bacterium]
MPKTWQAREVALVLPLGTARAMFGRTRRFDVERGGRFDARGAAVLLWSGSDEFELSEPVGCFYVKWRTPDEAQATIWRLEWDPERGGSEAEVRRAIAVLGGRET